MKFPALSSFAMLPFVKLVTYRFPALSKAIPVVNPEESVLGVVMESFYQSAVGVIPIDLAVADGSKHITNLESL